MQARHATRSILLGCARAAAAAGNYATACGTYVRLLQDDANDGTILVELGTVAAAGGYRSAALTAFRRAVEMQPTDPVAQTGYARQLTASGDHEQAINHYYTALTIEPDCIAAHQGLVACLTAYGLSAERHLQAGFAGHAIQTLPYRGPDEGIPLLLLVSARGGNIAVREWLDDTKFAVTALYADVFNPDDALPPHALILNAIGDADLCHHALTNAERIAASGIPILNRPTAVLATGRTAIARRFALHPDIVTPTTILLPRTQLDQAALLGFPLLLRSPGFHTGQHFLRIDDPDALPAAADVLPGPDLLALSYLDARKADRRYRKYRVIFIDGRPYPLHLAIGNHWKVHYFSAAMLEDPAARAEEARFLRDMPGTIGERAMRALAYIHAELRLDYAGVDFALAPDGALLLFEANATMALLQPDPAAIWDYRRSSINAAFHAAQDMLLRRSSFAERAHAEMLKNLPPGAAHGTVG